MVHREMLSKQGVIRRFDLAEGDLIRDTQEKITYRVTKVYPYIFTCRDFNKNTTSFPKVDYLMGRVVKVVKSE